MDTMKNGQLGQIGAYGQISPDNLKCENFPINLT